MVNVLQYTEKNKRRQADDDFTNSKVRGGVGTPKATENNTRNAAVGGHSTHAVLVVTRTTVRCSTLGKSETTTLFIELSKEEHCRPRPTPRNGCRADISSRSCPSPLLQRHPEVKRRETRPTTERRGLYAKRARSISARRTGGKVVCKFKFRRRTYIG